MLRFVDLFAGIGGLRLGLEQACQELGIRSKCVLSSEIDPHASKTYEMNFEEVPAGDIRKIHDFPDFDFLLAGFPCQPFSYAGKRQGFGDTRGTLFFEIERVLKSKRPKAFLLENVRGLVTNDKGRTFETILNKLQELGYHVKYVLLNSSNYNVPQNRVRIYVIGVLWEEPVITVPSDPGAPDSHKYKLRNAGQTSLTDMDPRRKLVIDILEENPDSEYDCSPNFVGLLSSIVGSNFNSLNGIRMIDYRNGNSMHSW